MVVKIDSLCFYGPYNLEFNISNNDNIKDIIIKNEDFQKIVLCNTKIKNVTIINCKEIVDIDISKNDIRTINIYDNDEEKDYRNDSIIKSNKIKTLSLIKTKIIDLSIYASNLLICKVNDNKNLSRLILDPVTSNIEVFNADNTEINCLVMNNVRNIKKISVRHAFLKVFIMRGVTNKLKEFDLTDNRLTDIILHENTIKPKYNESHNSKIFRL